MQRAVGFARQTVLARRAIVARAVVATKQPVAMMHSVEGSDFEKRRKAAEEQYFKQINEQQRKKYADKLHEKELRSLLNILPANHNLSAETLHAIMEWKHKDILV